MFSKSQRMAAGFILVSALSGCGENPASQDGRIAYGSPHDFDPELGGLQRLWANQTEQLLAAGIALDARDLPVHITAAATVTSAAQHYLGELSPSPNEASMGPPVTFNLKLTRVDQQPVKIRQITLAGGMPLHAHGLPTQPKAILNKTGDTISAQYTIRGLRFTMAGWWQLAVGVQTPEAFDVLTFNFFISP